MCSVDNDDGGGREHVRRSMTDRRSRVNEVAGWVGPGPAETLEGAKGCPPRADLAQIAGYLSLVGARYRSDCG